jgi:hypothetical protein
MALILAIEPDRRQASQLTAMVRGRLHAELVLGESAERALAALGQRVPDLILTSALLSPKDESALGERLRSLDGAAAHVQTLTIPVLASSSGRGASRAGGVLSALRRDKTKGAVAAADGCDPGVFAEQCKEYLERAATERATLEEQARNKALEAESDVDVAPKPSSSVVRPSPGREPKKAKADPSIVLPAEPDEPVHASFHDAPADTHVRPEKPPIGRPSDSLFVKRSDSRFAKPYEEPIAKSFDEPVAADHDASAIAATDPYVASAADNVTAAHGEAPAPAPEPSAKRKDKKSSKKRQSGIRSVLGLGHDENDGPASLLAAVAALEAEEQVHVEPIVETIDPSVVDTAPIPDVPPLVMPTSAAPSPSFESSFRRPPVVESAATLSAQLAEDARRAAIPAEMPVTEDILDLSSLLERPSRAPQASTFNDDSGVEVYELDNSLLSASFEEVVRPIAPATETFSTPAPVNSAPRAEGRSWPVLDTLIAETSAFQAPAPAAKAPAPTAAPDEAKPLGDILEALRRDAEQLPPVPPVEVMPVESIFTSAPSAVDVPTPAASVSTATPAAAPAPSVSDAAGQEQAAADAKKKKRAKSSPAQDEWGFFDPDQCGFAALIEKLEEITDKDDPPSPRRA